MAFEDRFWWLQSSDAVLYVEFLEFLAAGREKRITPEHLSRTSSV